MTDPSLMGLQPDGRMLCCICCEVKSREDMALVEEEPGWVWDVCKECREHESKVERERWCQRQIHHGPHGGQTADLCLGYPRDDR